MLLSSSVIGDTSDFVEEATGSDVEILEINGPAVAIIHSDGSASRVGGAQEYPAASLDPSELDRKDDLTSLQLASAPLPIAISAVQKDAILAGLQSVRDWSDRLQEVAELAQGFPLIRDVQNDVIPSLHEIVALGQRINSTLLQPAASYFEATQPEDWTTDGLVGALAGTNLGINNLSSDTELLFDVNLSVDSASSSENFNLHFGQLGESLKLQVEGSVPIQLNVPLEFQLGFGVDLNLLSASPDDPGRAFFVRPGPGGQVLTVGGDDVVKANPNFTATLGFLEVEIGGNSNIDLDLALAMVLQNPDNDASGHVTISELIDTPVGTLLGVQINQSNIDITLPVSASFNGNLIGQVTATIAGDPFDPENIAANLDGLPDVLGDLEAFERLTPQRVLSFLTSLGARLDAFRLSPVFAGIEVPFVEGRTFSDLFDLADALDTKLLDKLTIEGQEQTFLPTFSSAQAFAVVLETVLDLESGVVDATFDSELDELIFHVELTHQFDQIALGIDLDLDLGDVVGLRTTSQVTIDTSVDLSLDIGFDLGATTNGDGELVAGLFIENASIGAALEMGAQDIAAEARFGFLGIESSGGSAGVSARLALEMTDPEGQTRIDLPELVEALKNDPTSLGTAILTGIVPGVPQASFILGNIRPSGFTIPGQEEAEASITVQIPDLSNPTSFLYQPNNFEQFLNFRKLGPEHVVALLSQAAAFLQSTQDVAILNQKLPLIDRSVNELINYADQFAQVIAPVLTDPGQAVQALGKKLDGLLKNLLGRDSHARPGKPFVSLSIDQGPALRIDLNLASVFKDQLKFQLDLGQLLEAIDIPQLEGFGQLVQAGGGGQLDTTVTAFLELSLGLDLSTDTPALFMYDSSKIGLGVSVLGEGIDLGVALGAIGVKIAGGKVVLDRDGDSTTVDATLLALNVKDDPADGRYFFSELVGEGRIPLTDLIVPTITGGASATLPLFFPTESNLIGSFDFTIGKLNDITNPMTTTIDGQNLPDVEDFENLVSAQGILELLNNPTVLIDGLDGILGSVQSALESEILGATFPMVGDGLKDGAAAILSFREGMLTQIKQSIGGSDLRTLIDDGLTSLFTGLNLLRSDDPDLVNVRWLDASGIDLGDNPMFADVEAFQIDLDLHQALIDAGFDLDFDIGLPNLNFDVDGKVNFKLGWDAVLSFGVSREDGFYFNTSQDDELSIHFKVTAPQLNASGTLGFLEFTATDNGSKFEGQFAVDVKDPGGANDPPDGRLTIKELGAGFNATFDATLAATASIKLGLKASFGANASFPSILTQFNLDWAFGISDGDLSGQKPIVVFKDTKIDLGSLIQKFAKPILEEIKKITAPFTEPLFNDKSLTDIFIDPLPVISDLSVKAGRGSVSLLDLIGLEIGPAKKKQIETFLNAIELGGNTIDLVSDDDTEGIFIVFPDDLSLADKDPRTDTNLKSVLDRKYNDIDVSQQLGDTTPSWMTSFLTNINELGLDIPLLKNPGAAFGLLMGKPVTLLTYEAPEAEFSFGYDQSFPIFGPLFADLGGRLGFSADFAFGFDTAGLQSYFNSGKRAHISQIFNGFFISDGENADGTGRDVPEIRLAGSITAGTSLGGIAGAKGGIFANVNMNLKDPNQDGKIRFKELQRNFQTGGILNLFDARGVLSAEFFAFWDPPLFEPKVFPLAKKVLMDFTSGSTPANSLTIEQQKAFKDGADGVAGAIGGLNSGVGSSPPSATPDIKGVGTAPLPGGIDIGALLSQQLPLVNRSIVDQIDFQSGIAGLSSAMDGYFASTDTPTLDGLATVLELLPNIDSVDFEFSPDESELVFNILFHDQVTESVPLALSLEAPELGLSLDVQTTANLTTGVDIDFALGIDLDTNTPFVNLNEITFRADADVADLDVDVKLAFLGAQIVDGELDLGAEIRIDVSDPNSDGRLSLDELSTDIFAVSFVTDLEVILPVQASIAGVRLPVDPNVNPLIRIQDENVFDDQPPTVIASNLDELANFRHMSAGTLVGLLAQLTEWLDDFGRSDTFATFDLPFVGPVLDKLIGFADVFRDTLLIDDMDDDDPSNDVPKLVDENDAPTFETAGEFATRIAQILGGSQDIVAYDPVEDTLTFTLDLSGAFGDLVLPVDFNLDLGPLLDLDSDSTIQLSASGGLVLTLGVFLGDAPASSMLEDTSLLSQIGDGVDIDTDLAITTIQDVTTVYGQLSGDAIFSVSVNGSDPVGVIVSADDSNTTVDDLVADINVALAAVALNAQIQAQREDNRVVLVGLAGVTSIELTTTPGDPAINDLGFSNGQMGVDDEGVLKIEGGLDVPGFVGRLSGDAVFNVTMDTVNGGAALGVVVSQSATTANRNILDILSDVRNAINAVPALNGKIQVGSVGTRLTLTALDPGTTNFTITAAAGTPAVTELGLDTSNVGTSVDLIITSRDGARSGITLDGLTTLAEVIGAIDTQSSGRVTAAINEAGTGLTLSDSTSGGAVFMVEPVNGSTAALQLGIQLADASGDDTPDGLIEGAAIGGLSALDRFFIKDATANIAVTLSTPETDTNGDGVVDDADGDGQLDDGLRATGRFGFVSVELSGGGTLDLGLALGLQDPGTEAQDGRITLSELFEGLSDTRSLVAAPVLTGGGSILLGISMSPEIPGIDVPENAQIGITVNNWGDPFGDPFVPPEIVFVTPDLGDLIAFDNVAFNFDSILDGLLLASQFLDQFETFDFLDEPIPLVNVSLNDLLSFVDQFRDAVNEARNNPAGTIQVLEGKLKQAFGLPVTSDVIGLSLDVLGGAELLRIDLGWDVGFNETLPLNLDLGLPDMANLAGAADLRAQGSVGVDLSFGIDLNNPSELYIYDSTGITGNLVLSGQEMDFRAALGALGVFVKDGTANLTANFDAGLDAGVFTSNRILLSSINFGSDFEANLTGSLAADLPVFFPTESIPKGSIMLGANLLFGAVGIELNGTLPGGEFVSVPPDLFNIDLSQLSLLDNLLLAIDGIDAFLAGLQDIMDGEVFGVPLPLVGDKLSSAARFIEDFRDGFVDEFRDEVENITNPDSNFVSTKLFELLGPSGLDILFDSDDSGINITEADIILMTNADETGIDPKDVFFQWNLTLGGMLLDVGQSIAFDIGLPGLGLETTGSVNVDIDWALGFGFGLNFTDGFYLDVSNDSELEVGVTVTVPGGGITGKLGILQIDAFDRGNTHLAATFGINVLNRSDENDEHLTFAELPRIGLEVGVAAEAVVDLGMALQLNSDLVPGAATVFPKIVADFYLAWGLGDVDTGTLVELSDLGSAFGDGLQLVEFRNVGLDLGSFVSDVIGPIVKEVQKVTQPIQPVIDIITRRIPVISDLANRTVTLLDLARAFAGPNLDVGLIESIANIITIINAIPAEADNVIIVFGSFPVFDRVGGMMPDLTNPGFDISNPATSGFDTPTLEGFDFGSVLNAPDGPASKPGAADTADFVSNLDSGGFGAEFSFPILNDPSQIFGLLLGREATLVAVDLQPFIFEYVYSNFFSIIGPLGVSLNGRIGVNIDLAFGYDTLGVRRFAEGGFRNPSVLFDGFFVDGSGPPQVVFFGSISAAAEVNLKAAKAGVAGGIFININFDLHDPNKDDKIRLGEIASSFLNEAKFGKRSLAPLAIFDVTGEVFVKLFAFIKVDLFLFSLDKEFNITRPKKIAEFGIDFDRVPTLATELPGGALQLNMGPNAGDRLEGNRDDIAEHFVVTQGSDANHVDVTAFGFTQSYEVSSTIIALGGAGQRHHRPVGRDQWCDCIRDRRGCRVTIKLSWRRRQVGR